MNDPAHTTQPRLCPRPAAVLVIDVQTGFFSASPPPSEAAAVIQRINAFTARARAEGLPVIFIQQDGVPGDPQVAPFTPGWELHPQLVVLPGDLKLRKTVCDAFHETPLESELRRRGIQSLWVMGYATEFCVDATVWQAASKGFYVTVLADAHTTNDNSVLPADKLRRHYNWAWANGLSPNGIAVVPVAEARLAPAG